MSRTPLTPDDLATALVDLDGWHGDTDRIVRTVTCASFGDAIGLVNAVARVADEIDHHPDIDIRYTEVTFGCWTHTAGGVTAMDVDLAKRIDAAVTLAGC